MALARARRQRRRAPDPDRRSLGGRPGHRHSGALGRPDTGEQSARFAELAFHELGGQLAAAGYADAGREVNDDCRVSAIEGEPGLLPNMALTGPGVPGTIEASAMPGTIEASAMPGAIVEALFLSNDIDAAFLATATGHDAVVTACERAIVAYFGDAPG